MIAAQDDALDNNRLKVKQLDCYLNGKLGPAYKGRAPGLAAMIASTNVAVAVVAVAAVAVAAVAAAATVGII